MDDGCHCNTLDVPWLKDTLVFPHKMSCGCGMYPSGRMYCGSSLSMFMFGALLAKEFGFGGE